MGLFKRPSQRQPTTTATTPPESLSLPVLNNPSELSLEAKLQLELRRCPTCAYSINNPMTDKCPRCFAAVPLSEHTNCGECSHQGNCTYTPP